MTWQTDAAWAAGFIDGEGCIDLKQNKASATARLRVTQVEREPLDKLVEMFGGKIYPKKEKRGRDGYEWQLLGDTNVEFALYQMLEHFTVKRKQVVFLLDYLFLAKHHQLIDFDYKAAKAQLSRLKKGEPN